MLNWLQQLNTEMADVIDEVKRSLVQITNGRGGAGAGTIWHPDGLIVTNAHVIGGRHHLHVTLQDGREFPARVLALGHPWGIVNSASAGIIIGAGAELPEIRQIGGGKDFIAISLRVRPGNSGGPLVDVQGQLIGINSMMTGPNVGVAVPVHVVKKFLREELGTPAAEPAVL